MTICKVLSARGLCLLFSPTWSLAADFAWLPGYIKALGSAAVGRSLSTEWSLAREGCEQSARSTDSESGWAVRERRSDELLVKSRI